MYFCGQLLLLVFPFWYYLFESPPFVFLMCLLKVFNIVYIYKEIALRFIDLLNCFYRLFISNLVFIVSFLLLTLGFVCCSFSSYFRYKFRILFWDITVSCGKPVMLLIFLLSLTLMCPIVSLYFHFHSFQGNFWFFSDLIFNPFSV